MRQGLILILTGGVSRRMGRAKALLPLWKGHSQTFVETIALNTRDLGARRGVVSSLPKEQLGVDLPAVAQPAPEEGQLSSLRLGWEAFGQDAPWVMMCLVDHPYVKPATYRALVEAPSRAPEALLWTPSYEMRAGHPVVFSRSLMRELMQSPLEEGARPVIKRRADRRHWVVTDDPAVLWDVDTPELYALYSERAAALREDGP